MSPNASWKAPSMNGRGPQLGLDGVEDGVAQLVADDLGALAGEHGRRVVRIVEEAEAGAVVVGVQVGPHVGPDDQAAPAVERPGRAGGRSGARRTRPGPRPRPPPGSGMRGPLAIDVRGHRVALDLDRQGEAGEVRSVHGDRLPILAYLTGIVLPGSRCRPWSPSCRCLTSESTRLAHTPATGINATRSVMEVGEHPKWSDGQTPSTGVVGHHPAGERPTRGGAPRGTR